MKNVLFLTVVVLITSCNRPSASESDAQASQEQEPLNSDTLQQDPQYADSLTGRWLLLSQQTPEKYVYYKWTKDENENCIVIEKSDTAYLMKIYMTEGAPDIFKITSVTRVYAGSILNTMEYNVQSTNVSTNEPLEMLFTPLNNTIQGRVTIQGYFDLAPGETRYFVKDTQKTLYEIEMAKTNDVG